MKRKIVQMLSVCLATAILFCGCGKETSVSDTTADQSEETVTEEASAENVSSDTTVATDAEYFSDRDFEVGYDEEESALILLNGDSAASNSDAVEISGTTITITDEGTYILTGTLDDGMIIVNSEKTDKTQIVLNGVTIHSETSAPIYILQSDKVFITTAPDTTNTLSNGGTFTAIDENDIDAAIFSKEDVTLNGSGTLVVTSPGGHGIVSKDSLTITSGSYDINCAAHALDGKDDICIANADFTIVSGKDGIHAENDDDASYGFVYVQSGTFDITAEGDGLSAGAYMLLEDGNYTITAGGGSENRSAQSSSSWGNYMGGGKHQMGNMNMSSRTEMSTDASDVTSDTEDDSTSMKGIKAGTNLIINGGTFAINSADDAVHSNTSVTVNGGTFDIAAGDDAFHAEETLLIADGMIAISESYEDLEGLYVEVTGGEITLTASDDGINAAGGTDASGMGGRDAMRNPGMSSASNGSITISGGTIQITASGDGLDANGTLEITGGYTVVCGPTQGDTAILDYDVSGTISGGTFIGTGASGMAQSFSDSSQGVVAVSVGNQSAGTTFQLSDIDGNTILTYTPDLSYQVVILSSLDIVEGETYTITVGTSSGTVTAN